MPRQQVFLHASVYRRVNIVYNCKYLHLFLFLVVLSSSVFSCQFHPSTILLVTDRHLKWQNQPKMVIVYTHVLSKYDYIITGCASSFITKSLISVKLHTYPVKITEGLKMLCREANKNVPPRIKQGRFL
jgi:hypothetical protein